MNSSENSLQPVRWLRVILLSMWVAGGIGVASLRWDWSIEMLTADMDYEFKDNMLEKQRTGLNSYLIAGYSALALIGFAGIAAKGKLAFPRFQAWHLLPICLVLWCTLSLMWSVEPALTVRRLGHLYMAILGGFGLVALLSRREILWAIMFSFSMLCLVGVVAELSLGTLQPWRYGYRFCGIGHPNETGLFAVSAVVAGRMIWLIEAQSNRKSWFSQQGLVLVLVVANLLLLVLTKSRTTLFSGVVAIFVIQYVFSRNFNAWLLFLGSSTACLVAALILSIVPVSVYNAIFGIATIGRSMHVASLTGRLPLWEEIVRQWGREPMLGYGYGGYWTTKRVEDFAQMFHWEPPNGHSIYIDALVETGPIGLLLLVLVVIAVPTASYFAYRRTGQTGLLFVIGYGTLIIIHGLAESTFFKGCFGPLMFSLSVCLLTTRSDEVAAKTKRLSPTQSRSPLLAKT